MLYETMKVPVEILQFFFIVAELFSYRSRTILKDKSKFFVNVRPSALLDSQIVDGFIY
jgi:hypothetical protein